MTQRMTDAEKYLMDVHGYLVIKQALTATQVDAANAAIDAHARRFKDSNSEREIASSDSTPS